MVSKLVLRHAVQAATVGQHEVDDGLYRNSLMAGGSGAVGMVRAGIEVGVYVQEDGLNFRGGQRQGQARVRGVHQLLPCHASRVVVRQEEKSLYF